MWTMPSYIGEFAFGENGALITGMFELGRAINEREGVKGLTKTQWYKGNGTQAADISQSDLVGLQIASSNYKTNLTRIYASIRALCPFFIELSSGIPVDDTPWSSSSLGAFVGSTLSPTLTGMRITDPSILQVAQDALDQLLFTFSLQDIDDEADTATSGVSYFSGSYRSGIADAPTGDLNSAQDAWDAIGEYTYTFVSKIGFFASVVGYQDYFHGNEWDATKKFGSQNIKIDFTSLGFSFPVHSTWYGVSVSNSLDASVTWSFGGASGTVVSGGSSLYYEGDPVALDTISYASLATSLDSETSSPASPPATDPATAQQCQITPRSVKAIYNISSVLSDQ